MGREAGDIWRESVTSVIDWWREAGVDTLVDDLPRDWLARPGAATASDAPAAAVASPAAETLPDTLDAFLAWRMGEAAPEADWLTPHVAPAGTPGRLMILTDMPERDDREALLGGAAGRLLDRMLAAIGESRDEAHIASLAIARPVTGQLPPDALPRLAALARHHIALAAPERLLLLGNVVSRALEAANGGDAGLGLRGINLSGEESAVVAVDHPRFLLERPAAKAEAWKQLLLFSRGTRQ